MLKPEKKSRERLQLPLLICLICVCVCGCGCGESGTGGDAEGAAGTMDTADDGFIGELCDALYDFTRWWH